MSNWVQVIRMHTNYYGNDVLGDPADQKKQHYTKNCSRDSDLFDVDLFSRAKRCRDFASVFSNATEHLCVAVNHDYGRYAKIKRGFHDGIDYFCDLTIEL